MRCPQFNLKTLLWLMAVVAAFLGGITAYVACNPIVPTITTIRVR